MNEQIKRRITQLNNGEVPNGYKKTEFGIFPCDWVTDKKLKDLGSFGKGKGLLGDKMTAEGVPCVRYGDIYMKYNHFHFEEAQTFVDEGTASESQPIHKGTLLFTGTGETADEIGKCVCYNGNETIYAGGDIITFVGDKVNPLFLAYQQYQEFSLRKKASFGQGHSVVHIQRENLEKLNVAYPKSTEEQSKIAEILMKWDEAIELYNQLIEKLKQLKSVCLKKMFPQRGEKVPEWRFKGFTDAWEQRKLGDIADIVGGGTPSTGNQSYWDGDIDWYAPAEIADQIYANSSQKKITGLGYENSSAKMLPPGTVLFTSRAGIGKTAILTRKGCTNQGFQSIVPHRGELYSYFIFSRTEELKRYGELVGAGSTFVEVSGKQMAVMELMMPPTMREQQTIGDFFQQLDYLITLHQCKVEKIKAQQRVLQKYLLNGIVRV